MIIELAPGIKFIRAQSAGFPYCHSILVDSDIRAVIDTGAGERAFAPINPDGVDLVINTHYHRDHTVGNHLFPNAQVMVHPLEYPPLADEDARKYYAGFHRIDQISEKNPMIIKKTYSDRIIPPRVFRVDGFLTDGDIIDFGHTKATVLHLPGHTPGHIGFYFEQEGIVCGADIDLIPSGPWYGDYLSNLDDFEASIRRILELKPKIYCCAHRKPLRENIQEKLLQYLKKIEDTEDKIAEHFSQPLSLDELVGRNIIYKKYDYPYNAFWERNMIEKHLERMVKKERIVQVGEIGYQLTS